MHLKNILLLIFIVFYSVKCSDSPVGHLEPLGNHRPPESDLIDDVKEWPNPREFWQKYVKPSRALVVREAAKSSNAFTAWTDEYLMQNYGDLEVRLEGKKEKSGLLPVGDKGVGRSTLRKFIVSFILFNFNLNFKANLLKNNSFLLYVYFCLRACLFINFINYLIFFAFIT